MSLSTRDLTAEFYVGLGRLVRSLRREHGDRELGVGPVSALTQLSQCGPMRATALAEVERVSAASMTRIVHVLEERGLVRRTADPTDGRAQIVAITDAGRGVLAEGAEVKMAALRRRIETLAEADVAALAAALPAIERLGQPVSGR